MKRSLLAVAIGLAFMVAGVATADSQKPTTEKKSASCCAKSADGAKACDKEAKSSCCKSGDKASACCPGECCDKASGKASCSHKEKSGTATQAKSSGGDKSAAGCCCGESCCKATAA